MSSPILTNTVEPTEMSSESKAFSNALLSLLSHDTDEINIMLERIKEEQKVLLEEVGKMAASIYEDLNANPEDVQLRENMNLLPLYTTKLKDIRKEMVSMVEISKKMHDRAIKLQDKQQSRKVLAERQRAHERSMQERLLARTANHLSDEV